VPWCCGGENGLTTLLPLPHEGESTSEVLELLPAALPSPPKRGEVGPLGSAVADAECPMVRTDAASGDEESGATATANPGAAGEGTRIVAGGSDAVEHEPCEERRGDVNGDPPPLAIHTDEADEVGARASSSGRADSRASGASCVPLSRSQLLGEKGETTEAMAAEGVVGGDTCGTTSDRDTCDDGEGGTSPADAGWVSSTAIE